MSGYHNKQLVWSDGACSRNGYSGSSGGTGVYWGPGDHRNVSAPLPGVQTSNRAELTAARQAVQGAAPDCPLVVHTDSEYVSKGYNQWTERWQENGWRTAAGHDVKNRDDWQQLLDAARRHGDVEIKHVPRHENQDADRLAKDAALHHQCDPYLNTYTREYHRDHDEGDYHHDNGDNEGDYHHDNGTEGTVYHYDADEVQVYDEIREGFAVLDLDYKPEYWWQQAMNGHHDSSENDEDTESYHDNGDNLVDCYGDGYTPDGEGSDETQCLVEEEYYAEDCEDGYGYHEARDHDNSEGDQDEGEGDHDSSEGEYDEGEGEGDYHGEGDHDDGECEEHGDQDDGESYEDGDHDDGDVDGDHDDGEDYQDDYDDGGSYGDCSDGDGGSYSDDDYSD